MCDRDTIRVLLLVLDATPELEMEEGDFQPERWGFEPTCGGSFYWSREKDRYELREGIDERYATNYKLLEEAILPQPCIGARVGLIGEGPELRPVVAIKRS
ncbi:hypothetical protein ANO11243_091060 [Dothideomycetidae sp. 11243]|nr:hypothetical protein ANO11243_091060 [fungal sp. No.11243]